MGAANSNLGRTKVLYATSLVLLGAKAKFLQRKPKVLVALDEISEICWPQSMFSVIVILRYFAECFAEISCTDQYVKGYVSKNHRVYYINITFPARVIVENIIPRNVIINRGAAEVDNHISRDDIFDYHPRRECNIYFIIPNRTLDP